MGAVDGKMPAKVEQAATMIKDEESAIETRTKPSLLVRLGLRRGSGRAASREVQSQSALTKEGKTLAALMEWSLLPLDAAMSKAGSHAQGLDAAAAAHRLRVCGRNRLASSKMKPWWHLLLSNIANPFNALLAIMALLALFTENTATVVILSSMIALSVSLGFAQEMRSAQHVYRLKKQIDASCTALRPCPEAQEGHAERQINREELVPGDIVSLATGSVVPADCLLLASEQLSVSQSSLTGEGLPQEKRSIDNPLSQPPPQGSAVDRPNLLFLGSHVLSGHARALVLTTGDRTYMGAMSSIAQQAEEATRAMNSFRRGVSQVSLLLLILTLVMTPTVFVIEGLVSHDWKNAALFCLSVAVGLVPEMLPMVLNANLARGAILLAGHKAIVKRLDAVQLMGAVDVLCSDKTGTLTEDQVSVSSSFDAFGNLAHAPLHLAYVNARMTSTVYANNIDRAILSRIEDEPTEDELELEDESPALGPRLMYGKMRLAEVPFDFYRRRVSTIFSYMAQPQRITLVCKGAAEEVLRSCTAVRRPDGSIFSIDAPEILLQIQRMAQRGERIIGVASRDLTPAMLSCGRDATPELEVEMTLEGFLTVMDPPKPDAREAIAKLRALGIQTKVLTGDALPTARRVCELLEIIPDGLEGQERCISGTELSQMKPKDFADAVKERTVFAKLTPIQKLEVVRVLREAGHRVAFLGDGVNDCPALRGADCGISVNSACDTAKDAASVILTDKGLGVILECVLTGRRSFANTVKYIRMAAASNFGNVISILVAAAWLPFTPMAPIQILAQNFLYDISQASIPWDNVDDEVVSGPVDWSTKSIARFMVLLGPVSSPFDVATFIVNWFGFHLKSKADPEQVARFQTHWFLESLLTQVLVVHVLRTPKLPLVQSRASLPVTLTTVAVAVVGLVIPYTPLARFLKLTQPHAIFFAYLAGISVAYVVVMQLAKMAYLRVFKSWL